MYRLIVVMCRTQLGLKAQAWAWVEQAQALKCHELGLGSRLRLGSGLGWGLKRECKECVMDMIEMY